MTRLISRTTPTRWTDAERLALFTGYVYAALAAIILTVLVLL